jgi:hypothetical protein
MRRFMPSELHLIVAPCEVYRRLARSRGRIGAGRALRRPALVALVLGATVAIGATRHVTPALLLSTTACWAFVVLLQLAVALPLIAAPARHTVGLPRAIDLFFASHAPWSLWMLAAAAWGPSAVGRPLAPVLIAALAPLVLTPRMIAAFFREVLELDAREARLRTLVQQAATWGIPLALYATAVGFWPRLLERLR